MTQQHGLLVLNKPRGLSSAQCTNRLKRLGQKKIGHAGTLDPMATGVLLVLLGHATKISGHLMAGGEKTYQGTAQFGVTTDTWDAEGTVVAEAPWQGVDAESICADILGWHGVSTQPVPPYSAAKHQGQPLYKLSRAGRETPAKVKQIEISHAEVLRVALPYVSFRVTCSSGTYIRSLAHSLGTRAGCGAVLTELTREYSHPFGLDRAHDLDALLAEPDMLPTCVLPISAALPHWREVRLDDAGERAIRVGAPVQTGAERADVTLGEQAVLYGPGGAPLALAECCISPSGMPVWTVLRGLWH